ncbi:hypothetical protein N9K16_06810, partial [Alphaproteobacteria bacterium]|nr:hypothetical protein [Alphaproteobacteria bacterium]
MRKLLLAALLAVSPTIVSADRFDDAASRVFAAKTNVNGLINPGSWTNCALANLLNCPIVQPADYFAS